MESKNDHAESPMVVTLPKNMRLTAGAASAANKTGAWGCGVATAATGGLLAAPGATHQALALGLAAPPLAPPLAPPPAARCPSAAAAAANLAAE
eukprot:3698526-Pyramimonas_sp.AAC.1